MEVMLSCMSGPEDGRVFRAGNSGVVTIGRLAQCDIVMAADPDISRVHAEIRWDAGAWRLKDNGSTNGTFIGEFTQARKISGPEPLAPGVIFRVGSTRFRIEMPDEKWHLLEAQAQRDL